MMHKLKTKGFDYTGSNLTENDAVKKGYSLLSSKELLSKISNKTIFGDYLMGYKLWQKSITTELLMALIM